MKNTSKKLAALLGVATMTMGMLTGCGSSAEDKKTDATETPTETATADANTDGNADATEAPEEDAPADLNGTITLAGSTSMEKMANALGEAFMEKYPGVTVTTEFTGSSAGIEALTAGTVQIGNASRNLKDSEKEAGAVENIVAIDGISIVVDKDNTVDNLTKDQLIGIYKGEIKNWSEIGGNDAAIVVIGREAASGTRGAFEELLEIEDACAYANELDSTGAVMAKVASTPGAIGYVSLDVVDDTVNAVSLESVEPTVENIKAGSYFLSRPFVMATMGEISAQDDLVKAYFDYIASEEGKEIISEVGLITVD